MHSIILSLFIYHLKLQTVLVAFANNIHEKLLSQQCQRKASLSEEDWKRLKDYFADAATSLDDKKVTYYVWFHRTLHFVGIKISAKGCNKKRSLLMHEHDSAKACGYLVFY